MCIHEAKAKPGKIDLINSQPVTFGVSNDNFLKKQNYQLINYQLDIMAPLEGFCLEVLFSIIYDGLHNSPTCGLMYIKEKETTGVLVYY